MCVPVVSIDEWFADRPPEQRAVADAVIGHLEGLGEIEVDAAQVGILIKRSRTFAELRPHRGDLRLSVVLDRDVESPRITRRIRPSRQFSWHVLFVVLPTASDVDDEVRGWLTESFETVAG
jgi:hypothetical protein